MNLKFSYYKNVLVSMHQGFAFGSPSNAKPLFLLSIIKGIEGGIIIGNKIKYDDVLETIYKDLCLIYEPNRKAAPFYKPFYHSKREEYYDIKWKGDKMPTHKWHTPTARFLKDYVQYAYLDDGLWELLQDQATRNEFRELIVNYYLKTEK